MEADRAAQREPPAHIVGGRLAASAIGEHLHHLQDGHSQQDDRIYLGTPQDVRIHGIKILAPFAKCRQHLVSHEDERPDLRPTFVYLEGWEEHG